MAKGVTLSPRKMAGDFSRKRIEANMIAGPAWTLECCTFAAATGAARGSP